MDTNTPEFNSKIEDLKDFITLKYEHLVSLMEERDKRYEARFKGQDEATALALSAQKELTSAAFSSSKEAIVKAEESQKQYNQTHNDLSRKMDRQYDNMLPRTEAMAKNDGYDIKLHDLKEAMVAIRLELMKEIATLREGKSADAGDKSGRESQQRNTLLLIGIAITIATFLLNYFIKQ